MRIHSEEKINKIKEMRQVGNSINEIVAALGVPKTTVWHHVQQVEVLEPFKQLLRSKRGGRAVRNKKDWEDAENRARQILSGDKSNLAIAAAMLYWGEGGKKVCDIINTDPKLLQLYLKFLYEVIGVSQENIKFSMRIFTGMEPQECLRYWSDNLKIDPSKIIMRYNDGGVSGKAKYGMCRVTLKKGSKLLKLMHSLIRLSFSDLMEFQSPLPQWIDYRRLAG
jgi:hypothetical protein